MAKCLNIRHLKSIAFSRTLVYKLVYMSATITERGRTQASPFMGFDRAFQATAKNNSQERLSAFIAQWEVLLTLFKTTFEIPFTSGFSLDEEMYRTGLAQLMGMGESILALIKPLDDATVLSAGYSKLFVSSNVQYLRDKYEEHFFPKDEERVETDREIIWNALSAVNK